MYCKLYRVEFTAQLISDVPLVWCSENEKSKLQFLEFKMQRRALIDGWMNESQKHHKLFFSRNAREENRLKTLAKNYSKRLQKKRTTETNKLKKTLCSFLRLVLLLLSCWIIVLNQKSSFLCLLECKKKVKNTIRLMWRKIISFMNRSDVAFVRNRMHTTIKFYFLINQD